jgi:hypothetical protein
MYYYKCSNVHHKKYHHSRGLSEPLRKAPRGEAMTGSYEAIKSVLCR